MKYQTGELGGGQTPWDSFQTNLQNSVAIQSEMHSVIMRTGPISPVFLRSKFCDANYASIPTRYG